MFQTRIPDGPSLPFWLFLLIQRSVSGVESTGKLTSGVADTSTTFKIQLLIHWELLNVLKEWRKVKTRTRGENEDFERHSRKSRRCAHTSCPFEGCARVPDQSGRNIKKQ